MAFAAVFFAACSDSDLATSQVDGTPSWNSTGKGYVSLAVSLPTAPATRGVNDIFNDGTFSEYDVKDATLILFSTPEATTEDPNPSTTISSAYPLDLNFKLDGTSTDAITSTARITQEINETPGSVSALVVLNNNGVFTVDGADLKVDGVSMVGKTLEELNTAVNALAKTNWHADGAGFLMSNAVLTTAKGGASFTDGDVVTLVNIDGSKIFPTRGEADANPAANIYVERAEAKVTVNLANDNDNTVTDGSGLTYSVSGWALDNTNKSSRLVRSVADFNAWKNLASTKLTPANYRFVGSVSVGQDIPVGETEAQDYYRVYWGDDYNYTTTEEGALTTSTSISTWKNEGQSDYCFENMTDLATMLEKNLTRVIVKATFNDGEGFYTIDENKFEIYTSAADVAQEAAVRLILDSQVGIWLSANVKAGETFNSETDLTVELATPTAGDVLVASVALTDAGKAKINDDAEDVEAEVATWTALANKYISVQYYAGGEAYYPVYIAHFGDELTRWVKDENSTVVYDTDANYLGRWGVLRNNWYNIEVKSIKSLGSPTIETVTGETPDKKESFISLKINILPWAVRSQGVDL